MKESNSLLKSLKNPTVRAAYIFILPSLILIFVFRILPIFLSIWISMVDFSISTPISSKFVGLENFREAVKDKYLWDALKNTAEYSVGTVIPGILLGLIFALIISEGWFKYSGLIRSIYFIPVILSTTIAGLIFSWLYHPSFGLLNYILSFFKIPPKAWLGDPILALPCVMIMAVWKGLGYNITIWTAGLLGIPSEYRDAARVDGCNWWKEFWYIRAPLLKPVLLFLTVLGFINSFQSFEAIYVMTGGGPIYKTRVIVYYLWQNAFQWLRFGYAAAIAWLLFLILVSLTYFQFKMYGKEEGL